jgi:hypothetical protein
VGVGTTHRGACVGVAHPINRVGGFHTHVGHNRP